MYLVRCRFGSTTRITIIIPAIWRVGGRAAGSESDGLDNQPEAHHAASPPARPFFVA